LANIFDVVSLWLPTGVSSLAINGCLYHVQVTLAVSQFSR
jgi:hypothetical protein